MKTSWLAILASVSVGQQSVAGQCFTGTLNVAGSVVFNPVYTEYAARYKKKCPTATIVSNASGTTFGGRAVCAQPGYAPADVGVMTRDWRSTEAVTADGSKYQCVAPGDKSRTVAQVSTAIDGITIVVSQSGKTWTDCLSKLPGGLDSPTLRWIFSSSTTIPQPPNSDGNPLTNLWSEINPNCPATPIKISGPNQTFGTYDFFREVIFTQPGETFRSTYTTFGVDSPEQLAYLQSTDYSIGYTGYAFYKKNNATLQAIKVDGVEPTDNTLSTDQYFPLGRRVQSNVLLTTPDVLEKVKCFFSYVFTTEGAKVITDVGFLALPQEEWANQLNKIPGTCPGFGPPTPAPVTAPAPAPTQPPTCFSGFNTVELKGYGDIKMAELKIGDYVKVGNGKYTQVYGFGHYDIDRVETFVKLHFNVIDPLEISANHLVFVLKNGINTPVRAAEVMIGDSLSGKIVTSIDTVTRRGLYAPLTLSGDIIVSGILASNYVDVLDRKLAFNQHVLGHTIMAPKRLYCQYFMDKCKNETYIDGYGFWAYMIIHCAGFMEKHLGWFLTVIVAVLSPPFVTFIYMMESLNGFGTLGSIGSILVMVNVSRRMK